MNDGRHHQIGAIIDRKTVESAWKHSDNHEWNRIGSNSPANHRWVAPEPALPVTIADHRRPTAIGICVPRIVGEQNRPPDLSRDTQHLEVVAGNEISVCPLSAPIHSRTIPAFCLRDYQSDTRR